MKSIEKHIFDQSAECLGYASLGDVCVRIVALKNLVDQYGLDYKIIPIKNKAYYALWELIFKDRLIYSLREIQGTEYEHAIMHSPTRLDWQLGSAGFNVFESIYWENGFFHTKNLHIKLLSSIVSNYRSNVVMIYPNEKTDANTVYNSRFWLDVCTKLKDRNYEIHLIGNTDHGPLREFYNNCIVDRIYEPTIENLVSCIRCSFLALGSSTGPTWACLLSDIRQIVLESKKSPHGYWFFDRCKTVLEKDIKVLPTFESLFH